MTKRRIEVVAFERERVVRRSAPALCPVCCLPSELLTTRQAAALAQVSVGSIRRWLDTGRAHGVRTCGGQHRVCRQSLFQMQHTPAVELRRGEGGAPAQE